MEKAHIGTINLKKKYGQHFLRDQAVVTHMIEAVQVTPAQSILEIGCGDGFLTRMLLKTKTERIWVFEIDPEWAERVRKEFINKKLTVHQENILDVDFARLAPHKPWVLLANLPYQITFPILYKIFAHKDLFQEGVIMIQEEVAQKIVKTTGRDYGYSSLFFQHFFTLKLLDKVPSTAFFPPPKVTSRLVYFKPKEQPEPIEREEKFWVFIKQCFAHPRRTLKNNLATYSYKDIPEKYMSLRAQQMTMADFLAIWKLIIIS